ncbi:unnamed protein product [Microthlaspi erraticum]|uniref:Two-component response regulator n=1 Tax=Microthlaspi erraticum TaxID=1685480 RepID=A0A6D2JDU7_9BRAS|nr:unnamed protein product [Microthlaspi erraticum]
MTVEQDIEALDQFPVGMRVLAVDDDQTCLRILQTLLHRCQYHVTTTNQAQTALELLRENKNRFDLVISDVDMPDMDGFKLLELVGLEMDLPVIMLSAHSDPKYVMKGVKHGACDYLLKPVRIEELKNIWQHVVRKGKLKKKTSSVSNGGEYGGDSDHNGVRANRKRKDQFEEEAEEEERGNENDDPTAPKKPRVVWTRELHNKFLVAVDHLGVKEAVPKKILDMMNVDKLTRENVASHLQKFRVALKKITDEANQQANMAAIDSHFMQMSSLKGFGSFHHNHHHHHRQIGSGQYHNGATAMRHYPSNMTLGRLDSLAGRFPNVSSSLPRNHNDGGYILQGLPMASPSLTSQQSSLMASPSNLLLLNGQPQTSPPSLNPGFSPRFDINKRLDQWSNAALSTNIPQSDVHSKPDALEWNLLNSNLDTNPTTFCTNTDFGSSNAAQANCFEIQRREHGIEEGLCMGQQKQQSGFMASDAGSLNDIVNSIMTKEESQAEFSEGDLGFGWFSPLRTCI